MPGRDPTVRRRLLAVAGVLALVAAYLLVATAAAPAPLRTPVAALRRPALDLVLALGREGIAWLLATVAVGFALVRLGRGRDRPAVAPTFVGGGGSPTDAGPRTVEAAFDRRLDRMTRQVEDPRRDGDRIRERLRRTAVAALAADPGRSASSARTAVATGEWTDDRVAAAFLGDDGAPALPLSARLRGWIRPRAALRRRVDRTVRAIDRAAGTDR